jgi:hypothetical protein
LTWSRSLIGRRLAAIARLLAEGGREEQGGANQGTR